MLGARTLSDECVIRCIAEIINSIPLQCQHRQASAQDTAMRCSMRTDQTCNIHISELVQRCSSSLLYIMNLHTAAINEVILAASRTTSPCTRRHPPALVKSDAMRGRNVSVISEPQKKPFRNTTEFIDDSCHLLRLLCHDSGCFGRHNGCQCLGEHLVEPVGVEAVQRHVHEPAKQQPTAAARQQRCTTMQLAAAWLPVACSTLKRHE